MQNQTPSPDYVPRPSGSSPGTAVALVVAVVLLLIVVCGVGLLAARWLMSNVVPPTPIPLPQPPELMPPAPVSSPDDLAEPQPGEPKATAPLSTPKLNADKSPP